MGREKREVSSEERESGGTFDNLCHRDREREEWMRPMIADFPGAKRAIFS